jgi:hypothetical protein
MKTNPGLNLRAYKVLVNSKGIQFDMDLSIEFGTHCHQLIDQLTAIIYFHLLFCFKCG